MHAFNDGVFFAMVQGIEFVAEADVAHHVQGESIGPRGDVQWLRFMFLQLLDQFVCFGFNAGLVGCQSYS